jgi:acyl-CoA hydrolase
MEKKQLAGMSLEAVHWVQTQDLNPYGFAFGGFMMSKFDEIATLLAIQATGKNCVTAHVGDLDFKQPACLGDILRLRAEIVSSGRASIVIRVSIFKSNPSVKDAVVAPGTEIVMVAMDENFKPTPIFGED